MQKGVKFRAYPNKEQQNLINQTFGCCRLVYNKCLVMRDEAYARGERMGYTQTTAMLPVFKKEPALEFLKEVDSIALQQSLRDLDRAFTNFFQKRASHPTFKSKHHNHQSYRTLNQGNNIRIAGRYLKLPKLGYVKIRQSMDVGEINNVTVERTPSGKYFVVLNVEFEPESRSNKGGSIGLDMGIKNLYSDSHGNVMHNPKHLERSMRRLAREQRNLSRKQKGSNNRNKQRVKVALVHEKVSNQRYDFLQKLSTMLVRENQTICTEDISVKELIAGNNSFEIARKKHNLNRSQLGASWGVFFKMLLYKAEWYGCTLVKTPKDFPSSQICNCCGYINPKLADLSIRKWDCPGCGTHHDRDVNAAINILNKGLAMAL